jgi:hypothetical protein
MGSLATMRLLVTNSINTTSRVPTCHRRHGREGTEYNEEITQRLAQIELSGRTV